MSDVQLFCGDCLDILPTLKAGSVPLIVTSPPYNLGVDYGEQVDDQRPDYAEWLML